jgi:membrane protein DedA with SNARE-associated domain
MDRLATLFAEYGLPLVFGAVFLEQLGPPIPSGPLLIVAGALANEGRVSAALVGGAAWIACMLGKVALYVVGGRYGVQTLGTLCRWSMSPVSCIDKASSKFVRWGPPLLILAEFIPGVRTLAPALAGAQKLRPSAFLVYSALGSALWAGLYIGIGLVFREQIERVLAMLEQFGKAALAGIVVAIGVYFFARWLRRRMSLKDAGVTRRAGPN